MKRIPEPELMDSVEQTLAYAAADFSKPNTLFCQRTQKVLAQRPGRLLDLGCGSGGLLVQLAQTLPDWSLVGADAGPNMLALAEKACQDAGLGERITLAKTHLPQGIDALLDLGPYDAIVSNSLVHHLKDPMTLWQAIHALSQQGTNVVVMDLMRPESVDEARALVTAHTEGADEVLKEDFFNSLLAAWRIDEIKDQLHRMGWGHWQVEQPSNRHWLVTGQIQ